MIDWKKLKAAIAEDKRTLRVSKSNYAKAQATLHCAIAAHHRGHVHLTKWGDELPYKMAYVPKFQGRPMTLEEQAKFIERELKEFTVSEKPEEVLAETA